MKTTDTDQEMRELLKASLAKIKELKGRLAAIEEAGIEPLAIVGMACRFPGGADSPAAFWELLEEGRDAVRSLDERWALAGAPPGADLPRWAGLLAGPVDRFDAAFFGISPREAISLDPQQRLLLEIAWEALEDAGIPAGSLEGSRTGVFAGAMNGDHARLVARLPRRLKDAYSFTGNLLSLAAGRVSYALGLQGPAAVVDTACSSSLVAVHLASQSLRARECDLALAGGVNLILDPSPMEDAAATQALSPEGRSKTFDALANGFARGEGCGLVVLKRLSDARRDGDRIWALLRGSALNQDGRSTGLTAPSVRAQEAVLREALRNARVEPGEVGFVETHGTGTSLGDPIEVEALRAVLGAPRPDGSVCTLGAVKTNLGHLEAAAGVAALIKTVLALHHESIPANLHLRRVNPRLRIEGTALTLATEPVPWPRGGQPRFAGVSAFGMSGTNAHVVLEEAPAAEPREAAPPRSAELVVLSARSEAALNTAAARLHEHLERHPELGLGDVAFSLARTRSALEYRLSLVAGSREELLLALAVAAKGGTPAGAARGRLDAGGALPRVVLVFPGQGGQWLGMGRQLLAEEPVFRAAVEACDRALAHELGPGADWSLPGELSAEPAASRLGRIDVAQPVLFAMQIALAALWRSWGIEPSAVVGHSMGEVAAAHVAGALSLEDAVAVICRRSLLLRRISGQGEMALVELTVPEAEAALVGYEQRLSVAVSNSPRSTVLSGDPAALAEVLSALEARGVFCRRVKVDVASHSPQVDPLRGDLIAALAALTPRAAAVPVRSTVTGAALAGPELVAGYWADNLRQPVRFAGAVEALLGEGYGLFVEVSPHPVLTPAIEEMRAAAASRGAVVGSTRREQPERRALLEALGGLWAQGATVAWDGLFAATARRVPLPSYPWQRERYWLDVAQVRSLAAAEDLPAVVRYDDDVVATGTHATEHDDPGAGPSRRGEDWFIELDWEPAAAPAPRSSSGRILLLGDTGGLGAALGAALETEGYTVSRSASFPADASAEPAPSAVVHLGSLEDDGTLGAPGIEASLRRGPDSVLSLVQALAGSETAAPPRLWLVTRGAQAVDGLAVSVLQAPLLGLARVLAMEHPELRCACVDLDPARPDGEVRALVAEIVGDGDEQEIALRGGARRVARLVRRSPEARPSASAGPPAPAFPLRADGTYLVTGGLGGLGLRVAGWLAGKGAGHLVLVGRSGAASAEQKAAVTALEARGARVSVVRADVAVRAQIEPVLAEIAASGAPLCGVVHAAGVLDDGVLAQQSPARLRAVMAPKALGAWHLHELTRDLPLDFFVLYSSAAGLLGSPGQGNYAAANTFLDALAHQRRALGLPALAIDWGAFSEVGLAAARDDRGARLAERGAAGMTPDEGHAALERLLASGAVQMAVAPLDMRTWAEFHPAAAASPMFARLRTAAPAPPADAEGLAERLARAEPAARTALLQGFVRGAVSRVMRIPESQLAESEPLVRLGLDSLMGVEIKHRLKRETTVDVPMTRLLRDLSVTRLAQLLLDGMSAPAAAAAERRETTAWMDTEL